MLKKSNKPRLKAQVHLYRRLPDGRIVFLLLQRTPEKDSIWQCITGNLDKGETVEECAKREVAEETGLKLTGRGVGDVWKFTFESRGRWFEEHVFGFEAADSGVQLSREHQAFCWIEAEEAIQMIHYESMLNGLLKVSDKL